MYSLVECQEQARISVFPVMVSEPGDVVLCQATEHPPHPTTIQGGGRGHMLVLTECDNFIIAGHYNGF